MFLAALIIAALIVKAYSAGKLDHTYAKQGLVSPRLQAKYGSDEAARAATGGFGFWDHIRAASRDYWQRRTEAVKAARDAKAANPGEKVRLKDRLRAAGQAVAANPVYRKLVDPVGTPRPTSVHVDDPADHLEPVEVDRSDVPPGTWTVNDNGQRVPIAPDAADDMTAGRALFDQASQAWRQQDWDGTRTALREMERRCPQAWRTLTVSGIAAIGDNASMQAWRTVAGFRLRAADREAASREPRTPTSADWINAAKAAAPTCHWKPAKGVDLIREGTGAYVPMVCRSTGYADPGRGEPGCDAEWRVDMRWTGTAVEVTAVTQTNPGLDPSTQPTTPEPVTVQTPTDGGTAMTAATGEVVNHETHVAELTALIQSAREQVDAAAAVVASMDQAAAAVDTMQQTYNSTAQAVQSKMDHLNGKLDATTVGHAATQVDSMPPNAVNAMYDQIEGMKAQAQERLHQSEQALNALEAELSHVQAEYGDEAAKVAQNLGGDASYLNSGGGVAPTVAVPSPPAAGAVRQPATAASGAQVSS